MVARILTGKSIRGLLNYNESKVENNSAELILAHRFGLDISELKLRHKVARFEHLTKLNSRVKTNAVHIMLNFDPAEKLGVNKLQEIAGDYMDRIGLGEQPYLVYRHFDVGHPHIHLVTTNMRSDGTRVDMHNMGKTLSERARKEMEQKYGLVAAEGRQLKDELGITPVQASYGTGPTKKSIYNVVVPVLRDYVFTSLEEFNAVLRTFNVMADRGVTGSKMFDKRGLVYSLLDGDGNRIGIPIKASAFPGSPTLNKIERKFFRNMGKRSRFKLPMKYNIESVFKAFDGISKKEFISQMAKRQVSVLFRQNKTGLIYGVTYVDHNNKCVFNGSDLGKGYSAKAILERFDTKDSLSIMSPASNIKHRLGNISTINENAKEKLSNTNGEVIWDVLFKRPDFEPPANPPRKKKKKKQHRSQSIR